MRQLRLMGVCKGEEGPGVPELPEELLAEVVQAGRRLMAVPASVLYRPDRRIVPFELWADWPRIEALAREGYVAWLRAVDRYPSNDGLEELAQIDFDVLGARGEL